MRPDSLSTPERLLWSAFPRGAWVDLRTGEPAADDISGAGLWGPERTVRAEVIAALLLGARPAEPGRFPAVRLRGARITGRLDLMGATIGHALVCEYCVFDGLLRFVETTTRTVRIVASGLSGFNGARMRVEGILNLARSVVDGGIRLDRADVSGQLSVQGAVVGAHPDGTAIAADGLAVDGDFQADMGFVARGAVMLRGVRLTGSLDLAGARIGRPGAWALDAAEAAIGGRFEGGGLAAEGEVRLRNSRIAGSLRLPNATLSNPAGYALSAGGLVVDGGVWCWEGFSAEGEVSLIGAQLKANLTLTGARLRNPGGTALNLDRAAVGEIDGSGLTVAGGRVSLTGTQVAAGVRLERVRLANPGETALDARMLHAGEFALLPAEPVEGAVVLDHARIGLLRDDPGRWPERLHLEGLTYETLHPRLPASERLRWLARDPAGYQPQLYEQLAAMYTRTGQPGEALRVLHAKERRQRSLKPVLGRVWGTLQDATVAYGYQPWRAVLWLAVLLTVGSVVYGAAPPPALKAGESPHFNAVIYTLDLLLPIVDLGQQSTRNPAGAQQWFSYFLVAAGWVLATTIAAAVARVLSRR